MQGNNPEIMDNEEKKQPVFDDIDQQKMYLQGTKN